MRPVTVAATQFACTWDLPANADRAEALVRQAAGQGAQVVLMQELFAAPYFCIEQHPSYFDSGPAVGGSSAGRPLRGAGEGTGRGAARSASSNAPGQAFFNSIAMVDADGRVLGRLPQKPHPAGAGV